VEDVDSVFGKKNLEKTPKEVRAVCLCVKPYATWNSVRFGVPENLECVPFIIQETSMLENGRPQA
jgi:hypothetical protein